MTDNQAVREHVQQSREFLRKARQYLSEDDLHPASEKGWEAASQMAKAVAEALGWSYGTHDEFGQVLHQAAAVLDDERIFNLWRKSANDLHGFFYQRKRFLHPEIIGQDLDDVELMLDALEPLTTDKP